MSTINLEFIIDVKPISLSLVNANAESYANSDEVKEWAMTDYIFLKDIQENILDSFLNEEQLLNSRISEMLEDYQYNGAMIDIDDIIKEHYKDLKYPAHIKRVEESMINGLLSENIESLYSCYSVSFKKK